MQVSTVAVFRLGINKKHSLLNGDADVSACPSSTRDCEKVRPNKCGRQEHFDNHGDGPRNPGKCIGFSAAKGRKYGTPLSPLGRREVMLGKRRSPKAAAARNFH